jgi:hypothetical protein
MMLISFSTAKLIGRNLFLTERELRKQNDAGILEESCLWPEVAELFT